MIRTLILVISLFCIIPIVYSQIDTAKADKSLNVDDVRLIYLGMKTTTTSGDKINVYVLPQESIITRSFAYQMLGITPSMLFDRINYINSIPTNTPILVIPTEYLMIRTITNTPNSIGYISNFILYNGGTSVQRIRIVE